MNVNLISHFLGGSFGLFLCIQYIVFYFILARNKDSRKSKADLVFISLVGISLTIYALFSAICILSPQIHIQVLFYRLKLVAIIFGMMAFVNLLRYILVFIKDLGFVETDEYKNFTKKYIFILYGVSAIMIGLIMFTPLIVKDYRPAYSKTAVIFLAYLGIVGVFEVIEFLKIIKKELGKITKINRTRFYTILIGGIIAISAVGAEISIKIFTNKSGFDNLGSPYMYGAIIFTIAISLNLLFEYLEVSTRIKENNKKLSDLNKKIMDDIRTAQSLQISLLPIDKQRDIQEFLDMEISYMPMQSVGGDYYDFYNLGNDKVLIILGDASGHGVYAAMIWAMLKVEVEELVEEKIFSNLAEAFTTLNRRITKILENTYSYATMFSCVIDLKAKNITYVSAGHIDQLFYSFREGDVVKIRNKNPIVGTFRKAKYQSDVISYVKGDTFLLFTDGIPEGTNPENIQLGSSKLEDMFTIACKNEEEASLILNSILSEMEEFTEGTMQHDDRTVMVIKL